MAKNENRKEVTIKCTNCGKELRPVSKNKKNNPERLELKDTAQLVINML